MLEADTNLATYQLLEQIHKPSDLRKLPEKDLTRLADELRAYIINTLDTCGGHFAGNLGTVELTIALHYLFNTPDDKIVWDVGHQAYPHKVLTERRTLLNTIRQDGGLAPFPKREESDYDAFGVGHSSTSISAALGMAVANKLAGNNKRAIAVIGDGAMTAGMAFEALNHAGDIKANLLVILNDNEMSISDNVGALSNYTAKILSSKLYISARKGSEKVLKIMPSVWELARKTETHLKGMVVPGTLFEELGFNYIGPIDGHSLPHLIKTLKNIKELEGPQLLHLITKKGKGYTKAEADPIKYHAVSAGFNSTKTTSIKPSPKKPTFSNIFGDWLCDMAKMDEKLIAITPAMREGSGLVRFHNEHPDKYFDVGIAEQHSVTFAAGLACEGYKPVVAIYSSFLQRAYDQLIHDVALQNLPVLFALDRAGLVGGDGSTHNGSFDLSYLCCIPNMLIMAPSDENELRQMLYTGFLHNGPAAVRYPRGSGTGIAPTTEMHKLKIGKARVIREGESVLILSFGTLLGEAIIAGDKLDATVVDMRFVKPFDAELVDKLSKQHQLIITIEDNSVKGGAGALVSQHLAANGCNNKVINLGLPDFFIEHGTRETLLAEVGLDAKGIMTVVTENLSHDACKITENYVNS